MCDKEMKVSRPTPSNGALERRLGEMPSIGVHLEAMASSGRGQIPRLVRRVTVPGHGWVFATQQPGQIEERFSIGAGSEGLGGRFERCQMAW